MTSQTRTNLKGRLENGDVFDATIGTDLVDSSINLADSTAQSMSSPLVVNGSLGVTTKLSAATLSAQAVNASGATFTNVGVTGNLSAQSVSASAIRVGATLICSGETTFQGPVRRVVSAATTQPWQHLSNFSIGPVLNNVSVSAENSAARVNNFAAIPGKSDIISMRAYIVAVPEVSASAKIRVRTSSLGVSGTRALATTVVAFTAASFAVDLVPTSAQGWMGNFSPGNMANYASGAVVNLLGFFSAVGTQPDAGDVQIVTTYAQRF